MPPPAPPQGLITGVIDSAFNALLLEAFFCGLYTLLFAYALRMLLRKKNKNVYASALTLLWVLVTLTFAFDWRYHRSAFVVHNDSPLDIANTVATGTSVYWLTIVDNTLSISCNWLADALLIWRCYILWEDKKWALLPLPMLLAANIVLGILAIISPSGKPLQRDDFIFLVSFFAVSIAITFTGTTLIILRILLVTRNSPLTAHTPAYRKIQRMVAESGLIYTIALFITGVSISIQLTSHGQPSIPIGELGTYFEALLTPLAGIAPTLIAVRVGGETPAQTPASGGASQSRAPSRVLSHLMFRRTSRQNDTLDVNENGMFDKGESPTDSSPEGQIHEGRDGEKDKF